MLDTMLKKFPPEYVWFYSPQAGPFGRSGIPDRVAVVCGKFVGIECKADANKHLTELQHATIKLISKAGGKCFVVFDRPSIDIVERYISASIARKELLT